MIKIDMPMPKNCLDCPLCIYVGFWRCGKLIKRIKEKTIETKRLKDCPLIEVESEG